MRLTTTPPAADDRATVIYDSRLDEALVSATRSSSSALTLVLRSSGLGVELGCVGSTVVGQVTPPGPAEVELLSRDRRRQMHAITDAVGGFVFEMVSGPFRLHARTPDGGRLATDWMSTAS
jgi:hypothetical protein